MNVSFFMIHLGFISTIYITLGDVGHIEPKITCTIVC